MATAIIETGGKQYRVEPGQILSIEKLEQDMGDKISFDQVLMVSEDKDIHVGTPTLPKYTVQAEVLEQYKGKKIRVFTYKSKKRQRRTLGHRQPLTKVKILSIDAAK